MLEMTFNDDDRRDVIYITQLLERRIGYEIDLFAMLYVRELENGKFAVGTEVREDERLFSDPREAAELFVKKRRERQLGFDFEAEK
jgi:hypothetical protein